MKVKIFDPKSDAVNPLRLNIVLIDMEMMNTQIPKTKVKTKNNLESLSFDSKPICLKLINEIKGAIKVSNPVNEKVKVKNKGKIFENLVSFTLNEALEVKNNKKVKDINCPRWRASPVKPASRYAA